LPNRRPSLLSGLPRPGQWGVHALGQPETGRGRHGSCHCCQNHAGAPAQPGATRMFAPQPLLAVTVAWNQGAPCSRRSQAARHVLPGARVLSGLTYHSTNCRRSGGSRCAAVNGRGASKSASPTASAICVSSVTSAGLPSGASGPAGGNTRRMRSTLRNSVLAPNASPKAKPKSAPEAR
jgi:hypothetical protein